jgi:hypothetical protein
MFYLFCFTAKLIIWVIIRKNHRLRKTSGIVEAFAYFGLLSTRTLARVICNQGIRGVGVVIGGIINNQGPSQSGNAYLKIGNATLIVCSTILSPVQQLPFPYSRYYIASRTGVLSACKCRIGLRSSESWISFATHSRPPGVRKPETIIPFSRNFGRRDCLSPLIHILRFPSFALKIDSSEDHVGL